MHPMLAGYVFKVFFIDECRPDNIPLTSEGRLAFIDAEHSRRPIAGINHGATFLSYFTFLTGYTRRKTFKT
jgi:hypothetical protein